MLPLLFLRSVARMWRAAINSSLRRWATSCGQNSSNPRSPLTMWLACCWTCSCETQIKNHYCKLLILCEYIHVIQRFPCLVSDCKNIKTASANFIYYWHVEWMIWCEVVCREEFSSGTKECGLGQCMWLYKDTSKLFPVNCKSHVIRMNCVVNFCVVSII